MEWVQGVPFCLLGFFLAWPKPHLFKKFIYLFILREREGENPKQAPRSSTEPEVGFNFTTTMRS